MKYTLTTQSNGNLTIETAADIRPPLGLVLPALQDVRHVVDEPCALEDLITQAYPGLPEGLQIHTPGKLYVYNGETWLDQNTELPAGTDMIAGLITFRNVSAHDIGITW